MAVDADLPVQEVPYTTLREKLEDLEQVLDISTLARWKSEDEWNSQKKGWEWLFHDIDTDSNGQISVGEYNTFTKFKSEHDDWEKSLRKQSARIPAGLRPRDNPISE